MSTLRPGSPSPSTAPRRPFVGRRAELEVLRAHLGRGRLIVVTGEPGIGKTRLAEEFAAEAEAGGAVVHWGRCWEGDGAPAFWPWIQIARDHARSTDDASVRIAMERVLGDLEGRIHETVTPPALDPAPARFRLFDTITTLLMTAATDGPSCSSSRTCTGPTCPRSCCSNSWCGTRAWRRCSSSRRIATSRSARRIR